MSEHCEPIIHNAGDQHTWILIERCIEDDTMIVICHWHHQPSQDDILEMIESVSPRDYSAEFIIAKA